MATNTLAKATGSTALDSLSYAGSAPGYAQPVTANETIPWRRILRILRKHWKASLAFALILEVAIAAVVFTLANTYSSSATIEVEPPAASGPSAADGMLASTPAQQDYLETQIEILQGDTLAMGVISDLMLAQNPQFSKRSWVEALPGQVMSLVKSKRSSGDAQMEKLLETYHGRMNVAQVKTSRLVEIQYESYDPQLSAQIVNTAVRKYMDLTHRSKYEATLRAAMSLSPELNDLKTSAEKSRQDLLTFQKSHDGVELGTMSAAPGGGTASAISGSPVAIRVSQLNQQLTEAIAERLQQQSYLEMLEKNGKDSLPQAKDDPIIQGLTTRVADVRAQLAEALSVYGGNNPQVRRLQQQAEELSAQLESARGRIAGQLQASYDSALRREQLIRKQLGDMKGALDQSNANLVQYDALKRDADATSTLYTTLSSQIKQMAVSGSLSANNIRVLDEARVPETPAGPHRMRVLVFGLLLGMFGGAGLAFVAEGMDDTLSTLDDLRGWPRLPALALVPRISGGNSHRNRLVTTFPPSLPPALAKTLNGVKIFSESPNSPEKESIRNLETAIRLSLLPECRRIKTVLITSSFPREGKTTVAVNLALALARHGKTCLIDADLRRPAITSSFGLSGRPGLQELLVSTQNIERICEPIADSSHLVVLGAGARRPDALEMLTSQRMRTVLNELQAQFEFIVIDSAPIIPFSDARWLSTISDGSILVARSGETTRKAVSWSMELLDVTHAPVLGIVLNDVNLESEYYSYGSHYSYPQSK